MDPLPPEVQRRLDALAGGRVALVFDATAPDDGRAVLYVAAPRQAPLSLVVHGVHLASWGFRSTPSLRVLWRFASPLRALRIATVRLFDALRGGPAQRAPTPLAHAVHPPGARGPAVVTTTSIAVARYGVPTVPQEPPPPPADRALRIELDFEGDAPLVFEGHAVWLGPVPPPGARSPAEAAPTDLPALPKLWVRRGGSSLPS